MRCGCVDVNMDVMSPRPVYLELGFFADVGVSQETADLHLAFNLSVVYS